MSKDYKAFMTHAKKLTRNAKRLDPKRVVLQGVFHDAQGSLAVTDAHRLYFAKEIHELENQIIDPVSNSKIEGVYPDMSRLFPRNEPIFEAKIDVKHWIDITELFKLTAKLRSTKESIMTLTENKLEDVRMLSVDNKVNLTYDLSDILPKADFELRSNPVYWNDALRMFKALKIDDVILRVYGPMIPFVLASEDDRITALILPISRW